MKKSILSLIILVGAVYPQQPARNGEGYYTTGSAIRVKRILFVDVNIYAIVHMMKEFPPVRTRQAVIDIDTDKRIVMRFLRTVDSQKVATAVRDAFRLNGYNNEGNISRFLSLLTGDVLEGEFIVIQYISASKATTIAYRGQSSTIQGMDFMRAVWSCWFGQIDQPSLPEGLMSAIPAR